MTSTAQAHRDARPPVVDAGGDPAVGADACAPTEAGARLREQMGALEGLLREHRSADRPPAVTLARGAASTQGGGRDPEARQGVLQMVLDALPDGLLLLDADLELASWNDKLWRLTELDGASILSAASPGKALRRALAERGDFGPGGVTDAVTRWETFLRRGEPFVHERELASGRWIECRGMPAPGGGYLVLYRDVDERKRMEQELVRLAAYDDLTGLASRRSILEALRRELERHTRYGRGLSVLVVDVDHFKQVNDRHGHGTGDEVLCRLAQTMRRVFREVDHVGRLGGEEFVAVLPECSGENARAAAERLRAAVSRISVDRGGESVRVTVSVGVAEARRRDRAKDLLAAADAVLYLAKSRGRDRVEVSSET